MQAHVGPAADVDEHAACTVDGGVLQQRRGDGALCRLDGPVVAVGHAGAHEGHTRALHDGLDVGKIKVDLTRDGDEIGDPLHRLTQNVIGGEERQLQRCAAVHGVQQLVVGDADHRIYGLTQDGEALLSLGTPFAPFEAERLGDHCHHQRTQLRRQVGHDGRGPGAGATAQAGGDEHHVGALESVDELLGVLQRGVPAHLGVGAGTQPLGELAPDLDLCGCPARTQRLAIGVDRQEIHAGQLGVDHAVDGVTAAAADTHHLDVGAQRRLVIKHQIHLFLNAVVHQDHSLPLCSTCFASHVRKSPNQRRTEPPIRVRNTPAAGDFSCPG